MRNCMAVGMILPRSDVIGARVDQRQFANRLSLGRLRFDAVALYAIIFFSAVSAYDSVMYDP